MKGLFDKLLPVSVVPPPAAAITDNTAQVGTVVDMLGSLRALFLILTGTLADANATFAVLLEHSDTGDFGGEEENVPDTMMNTPQTSGNTPEGEAGFTFAEDDSVRAIEYHGNKRYVRITVTPAGNTGNAPLAVCALKDVKYAPPTQNANA